MVVRGKTILVIEDDAALRHVLAEALESEGYVTTQARDIIQAVQVASTDCPNLILLDVGVGGHSGNEILEGIKCSAPTHEIPVLIMIDGGLLGDETLCHADGTVPKPFDLNELLASVEHLTCHMPTTMESVS